MRKLNYALIGCGRISRKHINALITHRDKFEPVACVDLIKDRALNAATKLETEFLDKKINIYSSYEEMLNNENIDFCAIATPSGSHAEIALKCLDYNVNVLSEKPMALSIKDCNALIAKTEISQAKMTISMQTRFNPPILKLRKAIEQGKFGQIFHGQISVRWNRNHEYYSQADWRGTWELDGGALMNQCIHGIDLMQWMLGGEVKSIYGLINRGNGFSEAEDFGSAIVEFKNGSIGIIEGSVLVFPRNLEERLSIFGKKGTVVVGGVAVNQLETWLFEDENFANSTNSLSSKENISLSNFNGHAALYENFYYSIINNKEPFVTVKDGKKSVEIILGIYKSMLNKKKIEFPIDFSTKEMIGIFNQK